MTNDYRADAADARLRAEQEQLSDALISLSAAYHSAEQATLENKRLRAEKERLRADSDRIDWLCTRLGGLPYTVSKEIFGYFSWTDIREAFELAMEKDKA